MYKFLIISLLIIFVSCNKPIELKYPDTSKIETNDVFFGTTVKENYRWLEDDNSNATKEWVVAQNDVTQSYLAQIPSREKAKNRLMKLWNYERYSLPKIKNGKTYYFKNDGLQNQPILYEEYDNKTKIVLNPNELVADGTASISAHSFSKNGRYIAYALSKGGSDWKEIYVKDLETEQTFSETIKWVKFSSISWRGNGFYYSRYPEPTDGNALSGSNIFHQVYFHRIGTNQADDKLIFADRINAKRNFYASTTEDENFLIINAVESTSGNALYFQNLENPESSFSAIYERFDYDFNVIGNIGDDLYILTNHKAPMNRIIKINTKNTAMTDWTEVVAESGNVLKNAKVIGDNIVATYLKNAVSQMKVFSIEGAYKTAIELPDLGTIGDFTDNDNTVYFSFESFVNPKSIYQFDINKINKPTVYKAPKTDFESANYSTKQVFYYSKDSTKIPMFIVYNSELTLNGENPTWLYGYGGFNISITPRFSPEKAYFLEQGGIYAVANIRGGGEFGERWHKDGTVLKKQNVFDDFIAAGEYLINKEYTNSNHLAIEGRSNGGLLVGACMTQRPDLFKVALPGVGVLDMLRFHQFTIGWAWTTDYGSSEDSTQFEYLYNYSPIHNVKQTAYPATMITTGDHDDRVVPAHSFKFAATLQENQEGENPVLIRIDTKAGHGAGKSTDMKIEEATDKVSFVLFNL